MTYGYRAPTQEQRDAERQLAVDETIATAVNSLAQSFKRIAYAVESPLLRGIAEFSLKLGRMADALEGMERREARLEETLTAVEQSNRRLSAAMERLNNAQ